MPPSTLFPADDILRSFIAFGNLRETFWKGFFPKNPFQNFLVKIALLRNDE
jgi:hypothetical protein